MNFQRFGLLGYPLGHSLSGPLHTFFLKQMTQAGSYDLFPVPPENLSDEINRLAADGILGLNVTIPHKQAVISLLDEMSPQSKKIGAVNTIHFINGKKIGYNTDYHGFGLLLNRISFSPKGKKTIILGAGGSALASAHYLADQQAGEILIISRSPKEISHGDFPLASYSDLPKKLISSDLLINCTPVGMTPNIQNLPISPDLLNSYSGAVVDLIYNPTRTALIEEALKRSLPAIGGLPMLVGQGFAAQEIWQEKNLNADWLSEAEQILTNILETPS